MDAFFEMIGKMSREEGSTPDDERLMYEYLEKNPVKVTVVMEHSGFRMDSDAPAPMITGALATGLARATCEELKVLPLKAHKEYIEEVTKLFLGSLMDLLSEELIVNLDNLCAENLT